MAKYAIGNDLGGTQQAVASVYKTLAAMWASSGTALRRLKVYDILVGTNGTPADNYTEWDVSRQTADGTATTITPNPLDPADAAAVGVAKANYTVEGTITASSSLFYVGVNQRASYRWVAAPGSELVAPATNLNGFAGRTRSGGYTGTATMKLLVEEQ
jgi:hypothetical protein